MKTYFTKVTQDYWNAKNRLEEEAKKIARDMECRLIPETEFEKFKQNFIDRIEQANLTFKRCRPLELDFFPDYYETGQIFFRIEGVFVMELYEVEE